MNTTGNHEPETTEDDLDDWVLADPHEPNAPSRRSEKELNQLLSLLDSLERGQG